MHALRGLPSSALSRPAEILECQASLSITFVIRPSLFRARSVRRVASRLLFCQKVQRWIVIRESLPSWPADDRSRVLADIPRLLKGPKLVLVHATFVTNVTLFQEWFVENQRLMATALHTDLVLQYARCCRVMGCNKPFRLTSLALGSLLGSHFLVGYPVPSSAIPWKLAS